MKHNLLSRLLGTYAFVILLSLGLLSALFYLLFSNYYFGIKEQQLMSQGQGMAQVLSPYLRDQQFEKVDELVAFFNNANIQSAWVVDRNGNLVGGTRDFLPTDDSCPENEQLHKALLGDTVTRKGRVNDSEQPVLSVALPVYADQQIEGAIFVCNPLEEITDSILQALNMIALAGGIAVIIVIYVSYLLSRSIARPLNDMTSIAFQMAKGDFTKRAQVHSSDEVGKLAESFNYMAITLDKTLRDLEEEKNKTLAMEQLQREFVANASHELRTPLTSMRGFLEAILDGVVKGREEETKSLRIIHKETVRLHKLVNSLLDLSRIESGQIKVDKKELDISEIISRTTTKLKPLIEDHELELEVVIPNSLPLAFGVEDFVDQVLINFITNAVRFTPVDGKITVKAEVVKDEVHIHVEDTGVGIAKEDLPNVWKRFYKVNESRSLAKEGAGLGLSLVKEMVELQGGRVWVESTVGKGSVFSFSMVLA